VENLKDFLSTKDPISPVTFGIFDFCEFYIEISSNQLNNLKTQGYDFKVIVDYGYHSGGGSYVLSRTAFSRLSKQLNVNESFCQNTGTEVI
jgi:hypothetical protein